MKRKHKILIARIAVAIILLITAVVIHSAISASPYFAIIIYAIPYLVAGYDVLFSAIRNILHGQVFDENLLMCIATVGAFCIAESPEAVFVMVFYQAGELFQSIAVGKSRSSIAELMNICPESANVIRAGEVVSVLPEDVTIGETVLVRAGEKIPIDGIIIEGATELDTRALTGETLPTPAAKGDRVSSGCINTVSPIKLRTTALYEDSTVSKILELVENASAAKAKTEKFITRFARYYTPCVVIIAALIAIIPGIISGNFAEWLHRALIMLVISCPCALVISVPLSYFGGIGAASKQGILIKGANYLEALSHTKTVIFDKTGTLTKGAFSHKETVVFSTNTSESEIMEIAALLEKGSTHPIARSVVNAYTEKYGAIRNRTLTDYTEIPGMGITASVDGKKAAIGNPRLMKANGYDLNEINSADTVLFIAYDNAPLGYILIGDVIKDDARQAIACLKTRGINRTVILSGDRKDAVEVVGRQLGIPELHHSLLPEDKVTIVASICESNPNDSKTVFVGDGINDAPVLTRADIGVAMGALGSDAAIEAADVVLMDDKPSRLVTALEISHKTNSIVKQNIIFALGVKFAFLLLSIAGIANLWEAVFADVGVSVIAILNAMRTLKSPNGASSPK